jgi:hypothetical protein
LSAVAFGEGGLHARPELRLASQTKAVRLAFAGLFSF